MKPSGLGRGQKKQIEYEELLDYKQGKEMTSCPVQGPGVPGSSNTAHRGWPEWQKVSVCVTGSSVDALS